MLPSAAAKVAAALLLLLNKRRGSATVLGETLLAYGSRSLRVEVLKFEAGNAAASGGVDASMGALCVSCGGNTMIIGVI